MFCLDDGAELLYGPANKSEPGAGGVPAGASPSGVQVATGSSGGQIGDEPQTAILSEPGAIATGFRDGEAPTRAKINTTDETAVFHTGAEAEPRDSLGDATERQSHSANRAAEPQGSLGGSPEKQSFSARRVKPLAVLVVAAVVLVGGYFGYRYFTAANSGTINSIAVLPFENRSGNADSEYLSDGLSDSLIYRLTQLPNLKVSPTSSVIRYKGKQTDVSEIAKELEVDAVMTGKLAQRGDDLTISVELTDARTKKLIWAEQYDRKMSDLLATQREIAAVIVQKLELRLAGNETKGITKKYTDSNEAYQLYLKGRYHAAKRTRDDLNKGVDYFQQAVKLDPNFALAYAYMADAYNIMPAYPYLSPKEAFEKSQAAAKRSLEIDPTLAEGHMAVAIGLSLYEWKWAEAEQAFKRAIEIDSKNALSHLRYAIGLHLPLGRTQEAIKEGELANGLEPVDLVYVSNLAWFYMLAGRNDEALAQGKRMHDLDPDFILGRYLYGLVYLNSGMYKEALALTEKPLQSDPTNQLMLQVAGYAYAKMGRREEAEAVITRFREIRKTQHVMTFFIATTYAGMGEKEKAFAELEVAFQERDWRVSVLMKTEPMLNPIRDDPRFAAMLKRMNLPE